MNGCDTGTSFVTMSDQCEELNRCIDGTYKVTYSNDNTLVCAITLHDFITREFEGDLTQEIDSCLMAKRKNQYSKAFKREILERSIYRVDR
jgi:hypothetical protein